MSTNRDRVLAALKDLPQPATAREIATAIGLEAQPVRIALCWLHDRGQAAQKGRRPSFTGKVGAWEILWGAA